MRRLDDLHKLKLAKLRGRAGFFKRARYVLWILWDRLELRLLQLAVVMVFQSVEKVGRLEKINDFCKLKEMKKELFFLKGQGMFCGFYETGYN